MVPPALASAVQLVCVFGFDRIFVAGYERDRRRESAVGDWNSSVLRGGDSSGHSRHDLEQNRCVVERLGLLAPAAEDERIATLQAHDALVLARELDEKRVDLFLGH